MASNLKSKPKKKKEFPAAISSGESMEFRKTNEAIGLRIREGKLSLLSRKLFNVLVYHAQQLKEPGINAPIDTEAAKKYFWIQFSEVARDAAYDSNDTELLKQHLDEFQNIKIHIEDDRQWTSERLISSVKLVNPLGLKKKGGVVWLGFAFPPEVFELVMKPAIYTKLSIYYQGLLRSGPALALYEICRRYATNPSKVTSIHPYNYWHGALTGNPVREAPPAYKYFKRDVLKPAIAEINSYTDIEVDIIEYKNGRRVDRLQFSVDLKRPEKSMVFASPVAKSELISQVMKYGFTQPELLDLVAEYGENKLKASIDVLEARLKASNSPPLDSPAAYFRWLLRQGTATPQVPLKTAKSESKPTQKKNALTPMEKFLAARSREAFKIFKDLSEFQRAEIVERFNRSPDARVIKIDGREIESPMIRSMIGSWYAMELWGEPTAEALSAYIEKSNITEDPKN